MSLVVKDSDAVSFARGFKTWAENTSIALRSRLGIKDTDPLPPTIIAEHLGVRLWTPSEVPGLPVETRNYLLSAAGDEWSAVAVRVGPVDVIIVNSSHSQARRASDVMHELSHIMCRHEPAQVLLSTATGLGLRTFNVTQEAEANWLAGCLLLPRTALVRCSRMKLTKQEACAIYGVSVDLYTYRLNITGVNRQFKR